MKKVLTILTIIILTGVAGYVLQARVGDGLKNQPAPTSLTGGHASLQGGLPAQVEKADPTLTVGGDTYTDGYLINQVGSLSRDNDSTTACAGQYCYSCGGWAYLCNYRRTWFDFDISDIPDNAESIDQIDLVINVMEVYGTPTHAIYPMGDKGYNYATTTTFWDDMGDGTAYNTGLTDFQSTGEKTITLGGDANTHMKNQLTNDWFSIGISSEQEDCAAGERYWRSLFATEEDGTNYAELNVTFTAGGGQTIIKIKATSIKIKSTSIKIK